MALTNNDLPKLVELLNLIDIRMKQRGKMAAEWISGNDVLKDRELGLETDTGRGKIGDGTTAWIDLRYHIIGDIDLTGLTAGKIIKRNATNTGWIVAEETGGVAGPPSAAEIITTALAGSNHGLWLDCTDPATMYTDMAATTPVTVDGDAVAVIKDKSGLGFDASQSDPAKRAIYRRDGSGRGYLEFDGSKYYDAGEAGWAPTFTVMAYGAPTTNNDSRVIDARGAGDVPGGWQLKFFENATTLYVSEGSAFRTPGGLLPATAATPWLIVAMNDVASARTINISDTDSEHGVDATPLTLSQYAVTRIGAASNDASQAMVGRVYQIFFVDRVLEYAERRRVQLALSQ